MTSQLPTPVSEACVDTCQDCKAVMDGDEGRASFIGNALFMRNKMRNTHTTDSALCLQSRFCTTTPTTGRAIWKYVHPMSLCPSLSPFSSFSPSFQTFQGIRSSPKLPGLSGGRGNNAVRCSVVRAIRAPWVAVVGKMLWSSTELDDDEALRASSSGFLFVLHRLEVSVWDPLYRR